MDFTKGSPPRLRGEGTQNLAATFLLWIIPAQAGKRRTHSTAGSYGKDHPRLRGEKTVLNATQAFLNGLPPHPQGVVNVKIFVFAVRGTIPAPAGIKQTLTSRRNHGQKPHAISLFPPDALRQRLPEQFSISHGQQAFKCHCQHTNMMRSALAE